jgi:hypothetical protein
MNTKTTKERLDALVRHSSVPTGQCEAANPKDSPSNDPPSAAVEKTSTEAHPQESPEHGEAAAPPSPTLQAEPSTAGPGSEKATANGDGGSARKHPGPPHDQSRNKTTPKRLEATPSSVVTEIALDEIAIDAGTESRLLNQDLVKEYADAWKHKVTFPPVIVYREQEKCFLADGFHRVAAAKLAQLTKINAEVFQGGRLQALERSLGSNQAHGQRRTAADKEYAVLKAFREFNDRSDRTIAGMCGVSPTFVGKCRKQVEQASTVHVDSSSKAESKKRRGADGKSRRVPKRTKHPKEKPESKKAESARPTEPSGANTNPGEGDEASRLLAVRQQFGQAERQFEAFLGDPKLPSEGITALLCQHLVWCRQRLITLTEDDKWPEDKGYYGIAIKD